MSEENGQMEEVKEEKQEEAVDKVINDLKEKKEFAREQYEFLKKQGITDRLHLSRIFKAAGPGQIQEAWKLANCEDFSEEESAKDLLDCILAGATLVKFGWKRMEAVLENAEFYVPEAHNSKCFFRILNGAREILVPRSYRFSKKEMEEIKEGLRKKVHEDKDNAETKEEG